MKFWNTRRLLGLLVWYIQARNGVAGEERLTSSFSTLVTSSFLEVRLWPENELLKGISHLSGCLFAKVINFLVSRGLEMVEIGWDKNEVQLWEGRGGDAPPTPVGLSSGRTPTLMLERSVNSSLVLAQWLPYCKEQKRDWNSLGMATISGLLWPSPELCYSELQYTYQWEAWGEQIYWIKSTPHEHKHM